ncbi:MULTISPECIES: SgcJ/EcaC family oxidoreductase [unclassified Streptomyces]|uniref:SgcJ/EcaC family oxidoreductase n=1 Tax=unclassified Streptomyces TaxID=2593676 RepID=UPI0023ECF978|nr:SgcJ/EcaC family oxidoreductase [Streptomyces sp. WMMB303]MDF4253691.1 SgcJ/EcaC family oxidoreductase [Streptomyces sp. WMMB303]
MDMSSPTPPADEADEQRIRELVAQSQTAQADPDLLPALHTADAVIVNIAGRRLFGRDAFASAMAEALSSPLKDVRTSLRVHDIRFTTPDVAVVSLTKTVHDERPEAEAPSELPPAGAMTYVMTRQDGDWRITLAQTTPIR